jgi:D-serine deaminase-like pyridoxal phosphate-dependent protein
MFGLKTLKRRFEELNESRVVNPGDGVQAKISRRLKVAQAAVQAFGSNVFGAHRHLIGRDRPDSIEFGFDGVRRMVRSIDNPHSHRSTVILSAESAMVHAPPSHPNLHLVGAADARARMATPALIVELSALEANIAAMARFAADNGVHVRPHAKTHKSAQIAKRQIAAGAVGICTAKLGEAEALTAAGIANILVTSPVLSRNALERLGRLNAMAEGLMATIDHPGALDGLARAAQASGKRLQVLVDLNIGLCRTGIAPGEEAVKLGQAVAASPQLELMGLQAYGGHLQHINDFNERRNKAMAALEPVAATRNAFAKAGLRCAIVSGSGTGTFRIDAAARVFTELQVGSYVFMDREYNDVKGESAGLGFQTSLFVETSVISANTPGIATTDAGLKAFATEAGPPPIHSGAPEGTKYFYFGDEQGGLAFPPGSNGLPLDARIRCVTPHCDPTVNLYDFYHVMVGERLVALWPIEARGRSF